MSGKQVHKSLGPLVIAFGRMRDDVFLFGTIWMVLLLAFSTAMQGAAPMKHAKPDANDNNSNPMHQWR
eukprot:3523741-Rhodomonas_salina.1